MQKLYALFTLLLILLSINSYSQWGSFSGSLQTNTNFFVRDVKIGAYNMPQYDNFKVGTDAWLNLDYTNEKFGLEIGARVDFFYNSILRVPTAPYTAAGLGGFYIKKRIKDFTFTGGYLYDQIGSGILYRAYEERALAIDNALLGVRAEYNYKGLLRLKAFGGVQKLKFSYEQPIVLGAAVEGNFAVNEKVRFVPGAGIIDRSLDQNTMNQIVATIETYDTIGRFVPKYNTYAFTFYNTLTAGDFSWYIEGAYKTKEAIRNNELREVNDSLINAAGNCEFTSVNYAHKGFGITLQFKRTQNFSLHISPLPTESTFDGSMTFIPPVSRENSLRLPSRYYAPSLENHELAFSEDASFTPSKKLTFEVCGSFIRDLVLAEFDPVQQPFFGEGFIVATYKPIRALELQLGFQYVRYNKFVYQQDGPTNVDSYTPFAEWQYKINKKMSVRMELQYQRVLLDYGQWLYALGEFNFAPHFSIAASDMWNFKPNPEVNPYANHYYSFFVGYTQGAMAFTLAYVKQVEGIVCTGGVCRIEPAFSGVKFGITATF
jgi:hypothetical protein